MPTWNDKSELPDGSYSVSDIQDYFEYIIKKHGTVTNNPLKRICVNKTENRITFKIKTGYYPKLLTCESIKLLENTKNKITKDGNDEIVSRLEVTEVVLVHCNIVNNDHKHDSRALYIFFLINRLLDILPKNFIFLKIFNSEIRYIEVWFTEKKL